MSLGESINSFIYRKQKPISRLLRVIIVLVSLATFLGLIYYHGFNHTEQNKDFMRKLRKACRVPFGLPMPVFLLRFGAILIQTEAELILKSRKVVSKRLAEAGFEFEYPTLEKAFAEIV